MASVAVGVVLLVAFAICVWSGHTLAHHYQDRMEVAATVGVGVCVIGALVITRGLRDGAFGWPEGALAFAMSAGLVAGYVRSGRLG